MIDKKKKKYGYQTVAGFTLIETLLYIVLIATVIMAAGALVQLLLTFREKQRAMAEVEEQGLRTMQLIVGAVADAPAITTPATGSGTGLVVTSVNLGRNPTTFQVTSGAMVMNENTTSRNITNSWVTVSGFTVTRRDSGGAHGTVQIQFTLSASPTSTRSEQQYTRTFTDSVTLRP